MKAILPAKWEPRAYQRPLWDYLEGGGTRADVVAHRRWGKDEVALNWAASQAATQPGTYWHLLPEASQGRKAIWRSAMRRAEPTSSPATPLAPWPCKRTTQNTLWRTRSR